MSAGAETATTITDADRLAKLWDAYRAQEEELQAAVAHAERLTRELEGRGQTVAERERVLAEKDAEMAALRAQLDERDALIARLRAFEEDARAIQAYKDRIAELEAAFAQEKERLAKLFLLYEELKAASK